MKWRPAPEELVKFFDCVMGAVPEAERRKMFGYPAAFANGHLFASLHQESFVLKLAPVDYKDFLNIEGAKPFEHMPGRIMPGFVIVPPSVLKSPEDLKAWLRKAFAAALAAPPKKPSTKSPRK